MEFHEKLQELRKKKGLTQEELAAALFVSRTAVSKWESGRGYPGIDSLKMIAKFFSVTIDELLSSGELLTIAEEDRKQKVSRVRDLVFGLLDLSSALLLVLPFFAQKESGAVQAVSLMGLTELSPWLCVAYWGVVVAAVGLGILTLVLQNCTLTRWMRIKGKISLVTNVLGTLLFIVGLQPYAATFFFLFLLIKLSMLAGKQ